MTDRLVVNSGGRLEGRIVVPGDKSISHRAVMFSALADGRSRVRGCLMGEDVLATIDAFRAMGVTVTQTGDGELDIEGVGMRGLQSPAVPLDLGNSGTSMRLLSGILAGAGVTASLVGDASLSRRPMRRVVDPLCSMGAAIKASDDGTPPLTISAVDGLQAIDYATPVASAQVKSAVLLAGLYADGVTRVTEPATTRDHTERMLGSYGVTVTRETSGAVSVAGGQHLRPVDVDVPADLSSAAFFMLGASIAPGSHVILPAVGINPTRTGVLDILRLMGADLKLENRREVGGEPVADIEVRAAQLRGIEVPAELVPLAIDEFPAIFVAAACARGTTVVRGAAELRHKESDRIAAMARGLAALGITVEEYEDGLAVTGGEAGGGTVVATGDHRIAMSLAMLGLRASAPVTIEGAATISTSFPGFQALAAGAGLRLAAA